MKTCVFLFMLFLVLHSPCLADDNGQLFRDAEDGDPEACYTLAHLYLKGRGGLAQDVGLAVNWFERSVDKGHQDGAYNLSLLYLEGAEIEKNRDKALNWLEKAADNRHGEAQYMLGLVYRKTDVSKAVSLLKKAAAQDHQKAIAVLRELCTGDPVICE